MTRNPTPQELQARNDALYRLLDETDAKLHHAQAKLALYRGALVFIILTAALAVAAA